MMAIRTGFRLADWSRSGRPRREPDLVASLRGAASGVPHGMACALLTGVSPFFGLYAAFAGPAAGGMLTSTHLMVVSTTGAAALAAGSAVAGIDPTRRPEALFLLTVLAGVLVILAARARLGRYVRFMSHSVVVGFLAGVAVNVIAGQLPQLLGIEVDGRYPLAEGLAALERLPDVAPAPALVGLGALVILLLSVRSRFAVFGGLLAIAVPTVVVTLAGLDEIARVWHYSGVLTGVPLPRLPDLGMFSTDLVIGAVTVAVVVLVQGAVLSEAVPNPDGSPSDADRDLMAQGVANLAAGLWRGQPVAGSARQTDVNTGVRAETRWAAVWSGLWVLLVLLLFPWAVGEVAMPTLAAVLIFASFAALRPRRLATCLRAAWPSQLALVAMFLATLFLPITAAVGIGVVLSLLVGLRRESVDLSVVEVVPGVDGRCTERPVPQALTSHEVTVLDVYGSQLFAGVHALRAKLPDPAGTVDAAVVLRLRGRVPVGATFFDLVGDYTRRLDEAGGRMYLSGVDRQVAESFRRTEKLTLTGPIKLFSATSVLWGAKKNSYRNAETWSVRPREDLTR
jgi:sulfate permease, SulP family